MDISSDSIDENTKIKNLIKTNFIFEKKAETLIKKEISPIALFKGNQISFDNFKSRNLVNSLNNYNLTNFTENEFVFLNSKDEANKIIQTIDNSNHTVNDILEIIYKSISYDNTSSNIISKSLNKLYSLGLREPYIKLIKEFRMVISKDNIKYNKNYEIQGLFIPKNEEELKKYLIDILNILIALYDSNNRLLEKKIIKYEFKDRLLNLKENKDLNNNNLLNFAKIYEKIKFIKKYYFNQPIEYESNNILYYNKIINLIFDCFLKEQKDENGFSFNIINTKLDIILHLKSFIQKVLIKQLEENKQFTKELDLSLKFFIFAIDCKIKFYYDKFEDNFLIKTNDLLNKQYVKNYFDKNQQIFDKIEINDNNFLIEKDNEKIIFEYDKYDRSILDKIMKLRRLDLIEKEKYSNLYLESFQNSNFFSTKEINYLKKLLLHIINSDFFHEIIKLFSEKNILPNNILNNQKIQDYIISKILFLPYDENKFDTEAITFHHNAQISVSGYPYSFDEYDDNNIHHILELARKLIELIHEYIHSLKRYLNICTNGIISSDTLNEFGEDEEAGYLFELYLFGWRNEKYKNFKNLFDRKGNKNLKKGYFDIETSLNLLNPDLYNNDIDTIRNILFKNNNDYKSKEFNENIKNIELLNFLSDMGFKTQNAITELKKNKSKIYASRCNSNSNTINAQIKCGTKHNH